MHVSFTLSNMQRGSIYCTIKILRRVYSFYFTSLDSSPPSAMEKFKPLSMAAAGPFMKWVSGKTRSRISRLPGHLRNHDCANTARPPQHSPSDCTVLTAHAADPHCQERPALLARPRFDTSGNFGVMSLGIVGAQGNTRRGDEPVFLLI